MRINRFFTDHGICSRREADKLVAAGRVRLNGRVAVHGDSVEPDDKLELDGKPLRVRDKKAVVIAYHKPAGVECTSDPRVPENIIAAVSYPERVFHVGRLDKFSEGLILLTNRGELVNEILRAGHGHEKEYVVEVDRPIPERALARLRKGIELDGKPTLPAEAERLAPRVFRIVLREGRNRQIRRMCEALDLRVKRLVRVRVMNVKLGELRAGRWRKLTAEELRVLEAGVSSRLHSPA
ncbi:MAG TPA: pseudouridine synthase [Myxococcota bacterium]|nr:pseudouridine synthase [Myxococcota bacterium]